MTTIELRNVTRSDGGEIPLLDNITFTVPSGTSLAIVGPKGSGKSLLLRTIVGLESVNDGEILLDDALVNAVEPRDRDIAMVFQDYEIYPHLDVFDNMAFSARLRKGHDKAELADRVDSIAEYLGLAPVLDSKPRDLSPSQRQLVALGRVLVRDSYVYLFDDAFSELDERARGQARSITAQWQRDQGRTSIYVTDDIAEALVLGDQVAVMREGYLHQVSSPRDLYNNPADLFVAGFVGTPAMNLIPATVSNGSLHLPYITMPLGDQMRERAKDRDLLIVGIRPEDCQNASLMSPEQLRDMIQFSTKIDEVEWRGRSQYAYLGYEIDDKTEAALEQVERHLEFALFQSFLLAEVSPRNELRAGAMLKVAIHSQKIHVFDPATGENLTLS